MKKALFICGLVIVADSLFCYAEVKPKTYTQPQARWITVNEYYSNKPDSMLTFADREKNKKYITSKLQGLSGKRKEDTLFAMLKDRERCFLPKEEIIRNGKSFLPKLRELQLIRPILAVPFICRLEAMNLSFELGDTGILSVVDTLIQPVYYVSSKDDKIFQERWLELKLINQTEDQIINSLLNLFKDERLSYLAGNAILQYGSKSLPGLVKLARDTSVEYFTLLEALMALKKLKDPIPVKVLLERIKTPLNPGMKKIKSIEWNSMLVREMCITILSEIGNKEAINGLTHIAQSKEYDIKIRKSAKNALADIKKNRNNANIKY